MGQVKKDWEEHEGKVEHARMFCLKVGAIEECPLHEGEYMDTLEYMEYEELTDEILSNYPEAIEDFASREDMVECITAAMTTTGEECGWCASNAKD